MPSGAGVVSSDRIQPAWLHQKPLRGVCGSSTVSVKRWWMRWCPAHQRGPFCTAVPPPTASTSWNARPVLNARCEKYRWYPAVMKNIRPQNVTAKRIHAVAGTPVKIASSGSRWTTKNGMDDRGLMRP